MAKPGAGKRKMAAQRKKEWNNTVRSLKKTGRCFGIGKKRRKKKACYIATCVYGDYDSPEVRVLRRFRDNYLENRLWGRCFISIYYTISPSLVRIFGRNNTIKEKCKNMLNRFVYKLRGEGYSDSKYDE